jgi:hypothetical protein
MAPQRQSCIDREQSATKKYIVKHSGEERDLPPLLASLPTSSRTKARILLKADAAEAGFPRFISAPQRRGSPVETSGGRTPPRKLSVGPGS